jgi:hypothetical protein
MLVLIHASPKKKKKKKKASLVLTRLFAQLPNTVHSCGWHGVVAA